MLQRLTARHRRDILAAEWTPKLRQAFLEAVADILDSVVVRQVVERLAGGDVDGAVAALGIEESDFLTLDEQIRAAFIAGGIAAVDEMPARLRAKFDPRSPEADRWLREHAAELITGIVAGIVASARAAMLEGLVSGETPIKTVRRIVGRASRATGRRRGSLIGLTQAQADALSKARQELAAGDRAYLGRKRRDKRFDKAVREALDEGKPIPAEDVDRIAGAYADRLLDLRADVIAEDQTFAALGAAAAIAFGQQIAKGSLFGALVTKTWRHTPQLNGRDQHIAMHGQTVGYDEPFVAPDGTRIPYPHASGVPASHRIFCKCFVTYRVTFIAQGV